ncbi:MAG: hypothetical protein DI533_09420 [Cereibacter sphaeroides]|uniref:Uncharacterized protein n=1 Tax=Cereibacter sphaeroides TaxID=1063 RepID=A0A2W5SMA2_CERSP|nr:MAG: hypothetical protein DI533_09420 [Cereibacter sphaeroides]
MMRLRGPLSIIRCVALLAMLLPFMAVSALPQGFMPGRTESGLVTVVICTSDGPQEMLLDLGDPQPQPMAEKTCAWALAQAAATLAELPALPPLSNVSAGIPQAYTFTADHRSTT